MVLQTNMLVKKRVACVSAHVDSLGDGSGRCRQRLYALEPQNSGSVKSLDTIDRDPPVECGDRLYPD